MNTFFSPLPLQLLTFLPHHHNNHHHLTHTQWASLTETQRRELVSSRPDAHSATLSRRVDLTRVRRELDQANTSSSGGKTNITFSPFLSLLLLQLQSDLTCTVSLAERLVRSRASPTLLLTSTRASPGARTLCLSTSRTQRSTFQVPRWPLPVSRRRRTATTSSPGSVRRPSRVSVDPSLHGWNRGKKEGKRKSERRRRQHLATARKNRKKIVYRRCSEGGRLRSERHRMLDTGCFQGSL